MLIEKNTIEPRKLKELKGFAEEVKFNGGAANKLGLIPLETIRRQWSATLTSRNQDSA